MDLRTLWEAEDVRQGVLVLSGGRYRMICRVSAVDFWLLSEEEQNAVEDAAAALMRLTFPVQILVTPQAVDVRTAVDELKNAPQPRLWRPSDAVGAGVPASYHILERSAAHVHT